MQNRALGCSIWQNQGRRVLGLAETRAARVEGAEIRAGGLGFGKSIQQNYGWMVGVAAGGLGCCIGMA